MSTNDMLFFDTLAYANKLKQAGVPEKQAEVQSESLAGVLENNIATKQDVLHTQQQIVLLQQQLEQKIETLGYQLTIRLGGMLVVTVGVISALQLLK